MKKGFLRRRHGHGVHSPFAYSLITKVIEEHHPYYAYQEIEQFHRDLLSSDHPLRAITSQETQSKQYGAFLFRLVNFFHSQSVLQIGATTGVMSLYLTMVARRQGACYLLENRPNVMDALQTFAMQHELSKLHFLEGEIIDCLQQVQQATPKVDLLYINYLPPSVNIERLKPVFLPLLGKQSILVIDHIKDKKRKELFRSFRAHPTATVTVDMKHLGLVFFSDTLHKQHYKIHFNHGKKQRLHAHRRLWKHFFSRRQKSLKDPSSH
jgi:predicted O-methyltransferase YrrM